MSPLFAFAIAIAGASAITAGCAVRTGNEVMSKKFSLEGFQAAYLPHPGNITFIESWSREPKIESADQYPDAFKFRCIDAKGNIVPKDRAELCIPIVEFNVNAVDEAGNPHQFKGAYFISITAYGPNHRFVEVTDSVPKPPLSMPERRKNPPPATDPSGAGSAPAKNPTGFWEKIGKTLRKV